MQAPRCTTAFRPTARHTSSFCFVLFRDAGLFLGGYFALRHCEELGVTHILSIVNGEMSRNMCVELIGPVIKPVCGVSSFSDKQTSSKSSLHQESCALRKLLRTAPHWRSSRRCKRLAHIE